MPQLPPGPTGPAAPPVVEAVKARARRPRVLIVDDSVEMARTIADGLADRGYDAVPIASGREALARLTAEPFDALLTDLRMPGIDGLELLAASRRLAPDRPVIVMTGYSAIDTAVESIRRGAAHYLTKPFKLDELAIFLERALEQLRVKTEAGALRTAVRALARARAERGPTDDELGVDPELLRSWLAEP